jgi:hypothetical protein
LNLDPIAYWPLWEASGTTAHCLVNPAQNGTYNSDVSGWPVGTGIGDGNTAPTFALGYSRSVNINTATFLAALNGSQGSAMIWAKVSGATAWTDGQFRAAYDIRDNTYTNRVAQLKSSANNTLQWAYAAGGVSDNINNGGYSDTGWMCLFWTWDKAGEEVRAYKDGGFVNNSATLGVWAGGITVATIGSSAAGSYWRGYLAHMAVWDQTLSPTEVALLSTR